MFVENTINQCRGGGSQDPSPPLFQFFFGPPAPSISILHFSRPAHTRLDGIALKYYYRFSNK